jgi:hypothetical protein
MKAYSGPNKGIYGASLLDDKLVGGIVQQLLS